MTKESDDFFRAVRALDESLWGWYSVEIEDWTVHVLCSGKQLREARHIGTPLGGRYSAVIHPPHTPKGQKHLHLYAGRSELGSLNFDGTAHDQSHGIQLPNKVIKGVQRLFPGVRIPPGGLIEVVILDPEDLRDFLNEEQSQ